MSPAVPSGPAVAKALERGGFEHVTTRGSHATYRSGEQTVIAPLHRSLAPGTLRSILRQADWTVEDLEDHLK
ncbi:type II toxin-antitoxin system HicA family toxin [Streptomyces prasinus]|uniref:type II toxin-antitoxin system HicA family toxin n=1 Tax=Streptomyces prasinus TaxID=67345 RepID=UPI0033E83441